MKAAAALLTGAAASLSLLLIPAVATAGAWTQPKGKGQIIVKYEDMHADEGFDPEGRRVPLLVERTDVSTGVFVEYGLTDRLTLQLKGDWQDGEDQFVDYQGRGPLEVALVWQAWRNDRGALSVQAGYSAPGEGRNAGYEAPGEGAGDWEVRVSGGWSFNRKKPAGRWRALLSPDRTFVELQFARRVRSGLPDETRADFTVGRHFADNWMVLNQTYAGRTEDGVSQWVQSETSIVRRLGSWSVQAGWRATTTGRETPAGSGPIVGIWHRF
ncbi:MAG TPA: hypothetical protein VF633_01515 [Brevundimonas sp.]